MSALYKTAQMHHVEFETYMTKALTVMTEHSIEEDRFLLLGMSETAKVCIVCHCYRKSDTVIRIISARQATRKEEQKYVRGI